MHYLASQFVFCLQSTSLCVLSLFCSFSCPRKCQCSLCYFFTTQRQVPLLSWSLCYPLRHPKSLTLRVFPLVVLYWCVAFGTLVHFRSGFDILTGWVMVKANLSFLAPIHCFPMQNMLPWEVECAIHFELNYFGAYSLWNYESLFLSMVDDTLTLLSLVTFIALLIDFCCLMFAPPLFVHNRTTCQYMAPRQRLPSRHRGTSDASSSRHSVFLWLGLSGLSL